VIPTDLGDLLTGPWIPVAWRPDGETPLDQRRPALGLRELLVHAHEIQSLEVPDPPALSALYRVLYALAARVSGLDGSRKDWDDLRYEVIDDGHFGTAEIADYFNRFPGRFTLFSAEAPFFQDPRLAGECPKSAGVNKLVAGRAAGNNHSWFGHHSDLAPRSVPVARAFLDLLTWSYYGASGRCSARVVAGRADANTKAGPLRSALSYHPVGASLFETLVVGIPMPREGQEDAQDPCPWERSALPDPDRPAASSVRGVCSLLTARSQHALLLIPNAEGSAVVNAFITWAYRGSEAVPSPPDPYLVWQFSKAGNWYARRAEAARALWRDLDALQFHQTSGSDEPRQPPVVGDQPALPGLRIQALGFDQDGQAKDTQVVAGLTPPSLEASRLRARGASPLPVGDLHRAADFVGDRLVYAAKKAWAMYTDAKIADCAWSEQVAARYWPAAEEEFWRRLDTGDLNGLRRAFRRIAEPIYNEVTTTAAAHLRGARAIEAARFELYGGRPKKANSPPKERKDHVITVREPSKDDEARREFVRKVIGQCQDEYHPGIRATLRAGLGKHVDRFPKQAHQYVINAGLPDTPDEDRQHAYYAVAAMIASIPSKVPLRIGMGDGQMRRDFGRCLAEAVEHADLRHTSAENALGLLVKQSTDGLHRHLPSIAGRLTDRPGAVDWAALLADLEAWPRRKDQLSRQWLQSFYRTREHAALRAAKDENETEDLMK
jgi:CRISPR system Cascade subunit CasA